jgi:hypothetical protein
MSRFQKYGGPWILLGLAMWAGLLAKEAYHNPDTTMTVLIFAGAAVAYVGYGVFSLIVWAAPFVLIGGVLILAGLFVRKLVLDAVREARRD